MLEKLLTALKARFGTAPALAEAPKGVDVLAAMADRRVIRRYTDRPVDPALLETLCAVALSAPSKSDLQQADRVGLGTCPISAIRNSAAQVSEILGLPGHVFPVAALGVGWPSFAGVMSPRLGLDVTIHHDRYDEAGLREKIAAYDTRRNETQPYKTQRHLDKFGASDSYGWSEDKARQYSVPERADFGAFVRKKGFRLD